VPLRLDLTEAIAMIKAGEIDAQENPLTNTVTYGVHNFHRFHTLTSHFYISRPIFLNRTAFESWPADLQDEMRAAVKEAIAFQRDLHEQEEKEARGVIEAAGCEVMELVADQHAAFVAAVQPLLREARGQYGEELFALAGAA
jgi:TRAP-type C4-dicarboxylate transport system substrate-binding protein